MLEAIAVGVLGAGIGAVHGVETMRKAETNHGWNLLIGFAALIAAVSITNDLIHFSLGEEGAGIPGLNTLYLEGILGMGFAAGMVSTIVVGVFWALYQIRKNRKK